MTSVTLVLSTALLIRQRYRRVNAGVAVLLAVRLAPTQTVTDWLADWSVWSIVAVLGWSVHVPPGSPLNVCEYVNVFGFASRYVAVPSVPPSVSVTLTLPSTIAGTASSKLKSAVAGVVVVLDPMSGHVIVAVFAPFDGLGAEA